MGYPVDRYLLNYIEAIPVQDKSFLDVWPLSKNHSVYSDQFRPSDSTNNFIIQNDFYI